MLPNVLVLGYSRQKGSSLVLAVFALTILLLLTLALSRINRDANDSLTVEVWGIRALASAYSGADMALAKLFPLSGNAANCVPMEQVLLADVDGFKGCSVTLYCTAFQRGEIVQYRIVSDANCGRNELQVSRKIEIIAREP